MRANAEGRVSCPLNWDEIMDADPQPLLDLAARDEREGLGDGAWPPNFPKAAGEPKRVAPSRAKKPAKKKR